MAESSYVMIKKKLVFTWIITTALLFLGILSSFQYTNYVDRKSNEQLCKLVSISVNGYKEAPPNTKTGKVLEKGFNDAKNSRICK